MRDNSKTISVEALERELESYMAALRTEGLLDCHAKVFADRDTSMAGVTLALANALRLYRVGRFSELTVA